MIVVSSYIRFALAYALLRVGMSPVSEEKRRMMPGCFLRSLRLWPHCTTTLMGYHDRCIVIPDGISPLHPFASQQVLHL